MRSICHPTKRDPEKSDPVNTENGKRGNKSENRGGRKKKSSTVVCGNATDRMGNLKKSAERFRAQRRYVVRGTAS